MNFIDFAQANGLDINSLVQGKIIRCKTHDHPHKKNGAYLFDGDWGWVQDHANHLEVQLWRSDRPMTEQDKAEMQKRMAASRKKYMADKARMQVKAAEKAQWILGQCELSQHAYLDKKGFPDMRMNVWRKEDQSPLLVIPMRIDGKLCGVQLVDIEGNKKFLTGQRTNDATFTMSKTGPDSRLFLTEGYASALSLQAILATLKIPYTIAATFSAGNLARIAKENQRAFVVADNDQSGTGEKVALESGCRWWMPETIGQDINDFHQAVGLFKASQAIKKVLMGK